MGREPLFLRISPLTPGPCGSVVLCGISTCFQVLSPSRRQVVHALLIRSPLSDHPKTITPFDLHVLGTPPAFVLSQDQTLEFNLLQRSLVVWFFYFAWSFRFSRCCLSITKNQLGLFVVSLYSFQGASLLSFGLRSRSFLATALTVYLRGPCLSIPFFKKSVRIFYTLRSHSFH